MSRARQSRRIERAMIADSLPDLRARHEPPRTIYVNGACPGCRDGDGEAERGHFACAPQVVDRYLSLGWNLDGEHLDSDGWTAEMSRPRLTHSLAEAS